MAELAEAEGRSCLGDELDQSEPHSGWLGGRQPKLWTGCAAVQRGNGPHGRRRRRFLTNAMARAVPSAISRQLDEQTLTVFMPVSASARVL